jgi:hypothetical protein
MKPVAHIKRVICVSLVLIVIVVLSLGAPSEAGTMYLHWIDDITGAIAFYKEGLYFKQEYPHAKWEFYLEQMRVVRTTYETGDTDATYVAMNRFMDMLEARDGNIPVQAANELFNLCNFVTPSAFHDVERHHGPPRTEQPSIPKTG